MISSLKIQNLILIEQAEVIFGPHLNIITGETGSGKSAILTALGLIAGERADLGWIRAGSNIAVVEAEVAGKLIRREIHRSGKSRCFVDDALLSLSELRLSVHIERVDQSSSHDLGTLEKQREMLDQFAQVNTADFAKSYAEEQALLHDLEKKKSTPKERELDWAQKDLALIEEVNIQPNEEKQLTEEHHFLIHGKELVEKMGSVASRLGEMVPHLKRTLASLEQCIRFDAKLQQMTASMKSGVLELDEVSRSVSSYLDQLETDPSKLEYVEKRISAIEQLKRRFGSDLEGERQRLQAKIESLLMLDEEMALLQTKLTSLRQKNLLLAQEISQKRKDIAPKLSSRILDELKSLNIPHAKVAISIEPKPLSSTGLDEIHFLFSANPGVDPIPLEKCASGGELSRFFLALKTILVQENTTIVFDEIDGNVGGQTATVLGEKLKQLSQKRQVICVTHFVQVAKCAMDHFLVKKKKKNGTAITTIQKLINNQREKEYNRMLGQ